MKYFIITALVASIPAIGFAQDAPDPFSDYANAKAEPAESSQPTQQAATAKKSENMAFLAQQTAAGKWSGGLGTMFSYSNSSNELIDGSTSTNSNYLLRLDAGLSTYLSDQFEVGISAGVLMRRLQRENGTSAPEKDWLIQARTSYLFPITGAVGIAVGAGLGGYFGDSERPVESADGKTINETTSTIGLAVDANTGVIYAVSEHIQLRLLVNFSLLYGNENISSADKDLSVSTTQLGLALGLNYVF